jgi:hypothetical protein
MDQARDWVNLNCPDLEGEAHDLKVREMAKEMAIEDQPYIPIIN